MYLNKSHAILFVRSSRVRYVWVSFLLLFHLSTMLTISIVFLPHCVALLSFLPVEALALAPSLLRRRSGLVTPRERAASTAPS